MKDSLQAMNLLGIKAQFDDTAVTRIVELSKRLNQLAIKPSLEDKIAKLDTIDFVGKQEVSKLVNALSMIDKQFDDWISLQKDYRELLKSVTVDKVEILTRHKST